MLKGRLTAVLLLCCLCSFSQIKGVENYKGLANYLDSMQITFPKIGSIASTVVSLNQEHLDSLKDYVFPVIEKREMDKPFQIFANQQMAVMTYQLLGDLPLAESYQTKEIELIKTTSDSSYLMMAYTRLMFIQSDLKERDRAYATSIKVVSLLENEKDGVNKAFALRQLCVFYSSVSDFDRAKKYCEMGLALNQRMEQIYYQGAFYETLVTIIDQTGANDDESISLRRKAIAYAIQTDDTLSLQTMYSNLGESFAVISEADSAIKYFELSLQAYNSQPSMFVWVSKVSTYGSFLVEIGNTERAKELLDTVNQVIRKVEVAPKALDNYYFFQSMYHASLGNLQDSKYWLSKRDSLIRVEYDKEKAIAQEEMAAKYETDKKEAENQLLKAKNRANRVGVAALTGLAILLIAIVLLVAQRKKKDKQIYQQQQQLLGYELEKTKQEKLLADEKGKILRDDLNERIKQVMEQQVINGELMELIEELRSSAESPMVRKKTAQMKTKLNEQLTVKVFNEIYEKMRELYPELLNFLNDKIGKEKENEVISTAMYFMGYETRDIAKILQRTEKAVRSMRYRVRKKMELSDQDDLIEYLKNTHSNLV